MTSGSPDTGADEVASGLIVHSRQPLNAEPRPAQLARDPLTPQASFFVRCHGTIPSLDQRSYRLDVGGRVERPLCLSLADLQSRFAEASVTAVLQCAGNRRAELDALAPIAGIPWGIGAIGNARWTGVRLADVLRAAGIAEADGLHAAFVSHDEVDGGSGRFRYGVSIPLGKALAPDVLLAWAMNGEPLAPEHGFPLRVIVPGYAGVRSPKWLASITVQESPSDNPMQAEDYKLFPPHVRDTTADWTRGLTINEMPLGSAICVPAAGAIVPPGAVALAGYAFGSGRRIARVDVSADGGASWSQAALQAGDAESWSWTLWTATLDLAPGEHELAVRAWDQSGQTQPSRHSETWNFRGYLSAAWHRVRVRAV